MALTAQQFLNRHPEFKPAPDALLKSKLDEAERQLSEDVYGDKLDDAHEWLTADLLATCPWGLNMRQADDKSKTSYRKRFDEIKNLVKPRWLVT